MSRRSPVSALFLLAACGGSSSSDTTFQDGSASADDADTGSPGESDAGDDGAGTSDGGGSSPTGDPDGESTDPGDESEAESGAADSGSSDDGPSTQCDPVGEGTIYAQRDYETEDPEELFVEPTGYSTYLEGECWQNTNCWQVNPVGTNGNEDHAGWGTAMLPPIEEGGTQTMFIGHLFYVSSGMIDVMTNNGVSGKMLDGYQWDQKNGGGPTRQTVIWSYWNPEHPGDEFVDTSASGVVPRLLKGGAGGNYVRQVGPVQFDLADYADQWIWMEFEFNAAERYTAMWVKTPDGACSRAASRSCSAARTIPTTGSTSTGSRIRTSTSPTRAGRRPGSRGATGTTSRTSRSARTISCASTTSS
jgi:hypothetical protein